MIYLYGLMNSAALPRDALSGLVGQQTPPRVVTLGHWSLIYEDHDGSDVQPRRRNMLAHTRIVEHMMGFGTVLPARFGLVSKSIDVVAALVNEKAMVIAEEFEKLRGCVELGLRLSFPHDAALTTTLNASASLLAQRDRLAGLGAEGHFARAEFGRALAEALDRRRGAAQKALVAALLPLVRDHVLRSPDSDVEVLRLEVLIDASDESRVIAALEGLAQNCDFAPGAEPLIQIVGPAPSYNFVRLSLAVDDGSQEAA